MRTKRILVVEDEAIVAADLQDRLRALGYDPAGVVAAGEGALAKAPANEFCRNFFALRIRGARGLSFPKILIPVRIGKTCPIFSSFHKALFPKDLFPEWYEFVAVGRHFRAAKSIVIKFISH